MILQKAVIILILLSFLTPFVSAQHFFDYGYGSGFGFTSGGGFFDNLCLQYGEFFEFFVLFVIFFVLGHWAFKGRSKHELLAVVLSFALSFGLVRWESRTGFSLVCGFGDLFGGVLGGFLGLLILLLIIFVFFALARGGNGAKAGAGAAYLLFYFWFRSEGGYAFSNLFYYLPLDPYFAEAVLTILAFIAGFVMVVFGVKWFKGTKGTP